MGADRRHLCKGSHVMQAEDYVDEALGKGTFRRTWSAQNGAECPAILPNGRYQAEPLVAVLRATSEKVGRSVEEMTVEISRRNAQHDLTSIYRVFLRIAAPQRVLDHIPRLWAQYFDFGTVKPITNQPGRFVAELHGMPDELLDSAAGGWRGFVPTAIELAGGRRVTGTITARGRGADRSFLRFEATYSA